jgi:hypothetical protein
MAAAATLAMLAGARPARAQAVTGVGDDALTVPGGVVRFTLLPSFLTFDSRFNPAGDRVALGASLQSAAFGPAQLPVLGVTQNALRTLGGNSLLDASLGPSTASMTTDVNGLRMGLELGIGGRFSIGAMVPIVRTRTEFRLALDGSGATVGLNPALGSATIAAQNSAALDAQQVAVDALEALLATCADPAATDPLCATVRPRQAELQGLAASAASANAAAERLYGPDSPFAPLAESAAQTAATTRLDSLSTAFGALSTLGVPAFPSGAFAPATTLIGASLLPVVGVDPRFGFAGDSLANITRVGVGDAEVSAKLMLFDTPGREHRFSPRGVQIRGAISGLVRLATGRPTNPEGIFDPGTGDGQTDVEAAAHLDLLFGNRFFTNVTGRYVWQMKDELELSIAPPDQALPAAFTRQLVQRDLGDAMVLEAAPTILLGNYFSLGALYSYRDTRSDVFTGTFNTVDLAGDTVTLNANVLGSGTSSRVQRLSVGLTFSSRAAGSRGLIGLPFEVSYRHVETLSAKGAWTPDLSGEQVRIRAYIRLFGGP